MSYREIFYCSTIDRGAQGRNGLMKQAGLAVSSTSDPLAIPEEFLIQLHAITTKGFSEAARISITCADLPKVIDAMLLNAEIPAFKRRAIQALLKNEFDEITVAPDQPVRINYPDASVQVQRNGHDLELAVTISDIAVRSFAVTALDIANLRQQHNAAAINWESS